MEEITTQYIKDYVYMNLWEKRKSLSTYTTEDTNRQMRKDLTDTKRKRERDSCTLCNHILVGYSQYYKSSHVK